MRHSYLIGLVALLATACGGGGASSDDPGDPFLFRTAEEATVSISVEKYGMPVAGASVTVVEVYDSAAAEDGGVVFFDGGSSPEGRCEGLVKIPATESHVDVVVHDRGSRGPWTDVGLRDRWGPFAPSSRITVPIHALNGLFVRLEDR